MIRIETYITGDTDTGQWVAYLFVNFQLKYTSRTVTSEAEARAEAKQLLTIYMDVGQADEPKGAWN